MADDVIRITFGKMRVLTEQEKLRTNTTTAYKYVVTEAYSYEKGDRTIVVPIGFLTDGASWGPDIGVSWLFHDYLYATHRFTSGQTCTRREADDLMKGILTVENLKWYEWIFLWLSSRNICGCFSSAWTSSGTRGPEHLE